MNPGASENPATVESGQSQAVVPESVALTRERLSKLPPQVGAVLVGAGVAGMILPGPAGTPLLLAGGMVLVPRAFGRVERWVERRFPAVHTHGMGCVARFLDDFERRYPFPEGSGETCNPAETDSELGLS